MSVIIVEPPADPEPEPEPIPVPVPVPVEPEPDPVEPVSDALALAEQIRAIVREEVASVAAQLAPPPAPVIIEPEPEPEPEPTPEPEPPAPEPEPDKPPARGHFLKRPLWGNSRE